MTHWLLALFVILVSTGCRSMILPKVAGGSTSAMIPGGPSASLRGPENPAQASTQTVTRTVRRVAPVDATKASDAPAGLVVVNHPGAVHVHEQEETVVTTIGPTQDVAGVVREAGRALRNYWRRIAAVLAGVIAVGLGVYLCARDWPWVGLSLLAGGLGSIFTGTFIGVIAGVMGAVLLTLGYFKRAAPLTP